MPRVIVTPEAITLDGKPAVIQAGALHYFRLPHPILWPPVLERIRMGGLNAVLIPLPWAYHCPEAGFHDFTGPRDLSHLFDEVERAGLWLIPHLGPWVGVGLDAGGVPAWALALPEISRSIAQGTLFAPSSPFLRHLASWWDRAIALFAGRPNLIAVVVDPGPGTGSDGATGARGSLLDVLWPKGLSVPVAVPAVGQLDWQAGLLEARPIGPRDVSVGTGSLHNDRPHLAILATSAFAAQPDGRQASRGGDSEAANLPLRMAECLSAGARIFVLSPAHAGVDWGWWTPARSVAADAGAPVGEAAALSDAYFRMRGMALPLETMGAVLADAAPVHGLTADPAELLVGGCGNSAGTVALLRGRERSESFVELTLARDTTPISVGDIAVSPMSVAMLPMDWQLSGSRLRSTTLEPVLHTVVAGRELLILQNVTGGEVVLPPGFRLRHRRGPVYVESAPQGVFVHFDPARVSSVVLDGDQGPLQLLALDPVLSAHTWPLDDLWRTTPAFPASWSTGGDQPARGVVIGADFAVPEADGRFRILASQKGFGYRWGPWRGSDPHTWLAPLSWPAPGSLAVPPLAWTSRAAAPEVLPEYDDHGWVEATPECGLAPELYGIAYGFAWYRAHFGGHAETVRVLCHDACDLYLNGVHIASLNPPPVPAALTPKSIPLPSRHLRADNVLAVLVENQGRMPDRGYATELRGLISCELESSQFAQWMVKGGLTGESRVQGFYGFADWGLVDGSGAADVTWHRAVFDLFMGDGHEAPLFLFLDQTPGTCTLYLNGHLVGRSRYPQMAQRRFWLPDGLLRRRGSNELLLAQWTRGAHPGIGVARLEAGAGWDWRIEGVNPR